MTHRDRNALLWVLSVLFVAFLVGLFCGPGVGIAAVAGFALGVIAAS